MMSKIIWGAVACALFGASVPLRAEDEPPIQLPLVQDIPASKGYEGRAHDILGIRFGDTREDAVAKLKAAFPGAEIEEQSTLPGVKDRAGVGVYFDYVWAADVRVRGEPEEKVRVRFTRAATGGRVFAITRTVTYGDDHLASAREVKESIAKKYGRPTLIELSRDGRRDEITYTWENRPIQYLPVVDPNKGMSVLSLPANGCIDAATTAAYETAGRSRGDLARYEFQPPSNARTRSDRTMCIGGIEFTITYGKNAETVSELEIKAVDYDRTVVDAKIVDELLVKLQQEKSRGIKGSGAPRL